MTDQQPQSYSESGVASAVRDSEKFFKEFEAQPEDSVDRCQARAAHSRLMTWLLELDSVYRSPQSAVTDDMADFCAQALAKVCAERAESSPEWAELAKVVDKLGQGEVGDGLWSVLAALLSKFAQATTVMSYNAPRGIWEHTGFRFERGVFLASVGTHPATPVGFEKDGQYVGTQNSKLLWARPFGLSVVLPWKAPFEVTAADINEEVRKAHGIMTAEARAYIDEALGYLEEGIAKLQAATGDAVAEVERELRDDVALARVRIPPLEAICQAFVEEHPEFGENFEQLDAYEVGMRVIESLRMLHDEDNVRRHIGGTVALVGDEAAESARLIGRMMDDLSAAMPAEGQEADGEQLNLVIGNVMRGYTPAQAFIEGLQRENPDINSDAAAEMILKWLQTELERVSSAGQ